MYVSGKMIDFSCRWCYPFAFAITCWVLCSSVPSLDDQILEQLQML